MLALAVTAGCQPRQPLYLHYNEDLATYIDAATELAYPDVNRPSLDEVALAHAPMTVDHPEFQTFWDLSLQEAIQIALHNSKVIRNLGSVRTPQIPDALLAGPQGVTTVYDPASIESDPQLGVEAALAAFDAQFTSSLFWNTTDRPQNFLTMGVAGQFFPAIQKRNAATFTAELSKRSATGTQFFFRNITDYDRGNAGGLSRALSSFYTTQFETEFRHPILRGGGAEVNRIPVLLARIRTDVSLAEFEASVRNLVQDIESAYWEVYCSYQILNTVKTARDSTLVAWNINYARMQAGVESQLGAPGAALTVTIAELEAQARSQYFAFRFQTEQALNDLYNAETNLRWLMGLTASDGRLIRPIDEPTTARVEFDWPVVNAEAQVRSPELRQIKWFIKQRELEQIAARNELLPDLNVAALYRWVGLGDHLINADRNGLNFPMPGSTAFDELTEGKYEEARFGFDFGFPVGFRRAYSQLRNSQINLARDHARLEDAELNVSNALAQALRNMDAQYAFAQSHLNAVIAATQEVRYSLDRVGVGLTVYNDNALRAIQRLADSQRLFFRALCEYNKNISLVHYRKNSLLEYDGVYLAEGPWPAKAYFDAEFNARRRAASYYLDYGWTAPPPVSIGPAPQGVIGAGPPGFEYSHPDATAPAGEMVPPPQPIPDEQPNQPSSPPPDLLPPLPPEAAAASNSATPGVRRTSWNGTGRGIAAPPGLAAPTEVVAPMPTPTAAAYPSFHSRAPSAMSYRGLSAPSSVASPSPAPAQPSSRRDVTAASYVEAVELSPMERLTRLPPTAR
jgi:outer membrane protein TolC